MAKPPAVGGTPDEGPQMNETEAPVLSSGAGFSPCWLKYFEPPNHPIDEVRRLVRTLYGIDAHLTPLAGERDQNFLVTEDRHKQAVLKISNAHESEKYTAFQAELLKYIENTAPSLPTQRNLETVDGAAYTVHQFEDGQSNCVRLMTYLAGRPVSALALSVAEWACRIGGLQGTICRAMAGFDHPGANDFVPWNASSPVILEDNLLAQIDPDITTLLAPHIERLKSDSYPRLQSMRAQVIHNDMHPGNVLVDNLEKVCGVIDFGDAVKAPIIQELAVSATSLMEAAPDTAPHQLNQLVSSFRSSFPLHDDELALLHDAMIMRGMLSVVLGRVKDGRVPPHMRPRPSTTASRKALQTILSLHMADSTSISSGYFKYD